MNFGGNLIQRSNKQQIKRAAGAVGVRKKGGRPAEVKAALPGDLVKPPLVGPSTRTGGEAWKTVGTQGGSHTMQDVATSVQSLCME